RRSRSARGTIAELITAGAIGAVGRTGRLAQRIVNRDIGFERWVVHLEKRAEVAILLGYGGERDRCWCRAGIAEAVVVGEVEQLVLQRAEGNERAAEVDAVFIAVLDGF